MKLLHKKSHCCGAKIIRFGGKRRQCIACKKTWRVHPARPGRKRIRKQHHYLNNVFNHGLSVKQLALRSPLPVETIYKRFSKNLSVTICQNRIIRIRGKRLILLIDAEWQYFRSGLWTLYFMAVKSTNSETVTVFDPVLRQGKEHLTIWIQIINQLPFSVRKRQFALVSDGIRGIENFSSRNGWVIQRCHFHLLSRLQKMRGKRATTPGRLIREEIYCTVKKALRVKSEKKLKTLCRRLSFLSANKLCPTRMRYAVRDFLKKTTEFRNYLNHPHLNLPTTINVMESINSNVRSKAVTINSPRAWLKWSTAAVRFKSKFTCK